LAVKGSLDKILDIPEKTIFDEVGTIPNCKKCGLYKRCKSPKMKVTGQGRKKVLIIAEAPGKKEDEKGIQLIGESGQLLRDYLEDFGIDLDVDCWKTNSIICRPKDNRKPTKVEIDCCRPNLIKTIIKLKPKKILLLGSVAIESLIGHKESPSKMNRWFKWMIPDQEYKCFISINYHPSYLLRNPDNKALSGFYRRSLYSFFRFKEEFKEIKSPNLRDLSNKEILEKLNKLNSNHEIVFDYETTGLRPYNKGHEILCVGLTVIGNDKILGSFVFDLEDERIRKKWSEILKNKEIKKIAHNCKFENIWTKIISKVFIKGWVWDTMMSSHILDDRKNITGLKFQVYVRFGISSYEEGVKKYIKADKTGFNKMKELKRKNKKTLYQYCQDDSYYEALLYLKHKKELKNKKPLYFFNKGSLAFSEIEMNGILINKNYFEGESKKLTVSIKNLSKEIQETKGYKLFYEKERKELNTDSPVQLKKLFFKYMKLKPVKMTAKNNISVDEETLTKLKNPLAKLIIEDRKVKKIKSTYVDGFLKEACENNKLHPFFNLNIVKSYRSSSDSPNFQNIPKRDKKAQKLVRSGIIPSKGNYLMEVDFGGIEVCVSACYHKDPNMINYIKDDTTDMHRDQACELFLLKAEEVSKEVRYVGKNGFVFPEFYGSTCRMYKDKDIIIGAGEVTQQIWEMINEETKKHLYEKGIKNIQDFQVHVEKVENKFWDEKFPVFKEWKNEIWKDYLKTGKITGLTGFSYSDILSRNEVVNLRIQGAAFHINLWSLININNFIRKNKLKSKIIGQIHDSQIYDMVPEEGGFLKKAIVNISCHKVREYWDWIIVPLKVEAEVSEINGNWANMKEIEL
jgi:DNA polymerase I